MLMKNIIFIIFLILILIHLSVSIAFARRPIPPRKGCLNNLVKLSKAVEMYNSVHKPKINTVLPGRDYEEFEKKLIKEKCLNNVLYRLEDDCSYGFVDILGSGSFFCKKHGIVDWSEEKPKIPIYDKSLEKPFSEEYSNKEKRLEESRRQKKFPDKIIIFLFFITLTVVATLNYIFKNKKNS